MTKHLRFDSEWAGYKNIKQDHPQKVMKQLGITYQHETPQSMGGQWWFWNCENTPDKLPEFITVADWNPMKMIGWGLNKEKAEEIRDYR
jgi:hypothetical protein